MTLNAFTFLRGANAVEAIMPVHNGVLNLANTIVDRPIAAKRRIDGIRRGIGGYCKRGATNDQRLDFLVFLFFATFLAVFFFST